MIRLMRNGKYAKMFKIYLQPIYSQITCVEYSTHVIWLQIGFKKDQIFLIDTDHHDVKAINYFFQQWYHIHVYSLYKF